MIYLGLSIAFATVIVLVFRAFTRYRIDSLQAIVVNYGVCTLIGLGSTSAGQLMKLPHWKGLPFALLLGALFIGLFYLIARTAQTIGVTAASVAQKLSFVIPVVAGITLFGEPFSLMKLVGFAVAAQAVYFISARSGAVPGLRNHLALPAVVFTGSGVCDLIIKYIETAHLGLVHKGTFTVVLFGTAFSLGAVWLAVRLIKQRRPPDVRSLLAGVALGLPNYGSIYFLISALEQPGWGASRVFPVNNVGIILLSAVSAWLLFGERLNRLQVIGLALAVLSIVILI